MKRILFACCIMLIDSGCSYRSAQYEYGKQWAEREARLYDIPIPHGVKADNRYLDETSSGLAYFSSLDCSELVEWYRQQLDICGWLYDVYSMGSEMLIRAYKPTKWCSISVRPSTTSLVHVVIFTGSNGSLPQ